MPMTTESTTAVTGISSKFQGKAGFADTISGTYWETLPKMGSDEVTLQRALIAHRRDLERKTKAKIERNGYLSDDEIRDLKIAQTQAFFKTTGF